jgi:hypothetical protein
VSVQLGQPGHSEVSEGQLELADVVLVEAEVAKHCRPQRAGQPDGRPHSRAGGVIGDI